MQRAAARRERELDERLQQEDARIAAGGAPPAQDGAPAPSTPRSRTTSDVAEDGPIHQSETRGVDERGSSSVRRPADLGNEPQIRKAARSTPTSDDSWSPSSKRSRGLPRGTSQADYNAWMRANRGPMSYSNGVEFRHGLVPRDPERASSYVSTFGFCQHVFPNVGIYGAIIINPIVQRSGGNW